MDVKVGLSICRRNIDQGFLRIGCWGEHFDARSKKIILEKTEQ
jgi:hypothetical protein